MDISLIVAMDKNGVIGKDNQLPWHLPADLYYFKRMTHGSIVIMGRKCFESIGKPLPSRWNLVLTKSNQDNIYLGNSWEDGVVDYFNDIDSILGIAHEAYQLDIKSFVIGGEQVYKQFIPLASTIHMTKIDHEFEGDTYFPEINCDEWQEVSKVEFSKTEKNPYNYSFYKYIRK